MAYQFVNQAVGNSQVTEEGSTNQMTLKGINATTTDANMIREGLTQILDIVGWTLGDANRIVTQDIEEVT